MSRSMYFFDSVEKPLLGRHQRLRARAKVVNLSKPARLRLEWLIYYDKTKSASLVARHFGISRKAFYTWRNRYDELDLTSLEDHSRRPHTLRTHEYTATEAQRVVRLRPLHPCAGRAKLAIHYAEMFGEEISDWSLRRILADYNIPAKRAVRNRYQRGVKRGAPRKRLAELTKKAIPGFLVEVDTIVLYCADTKRYIFTGVDHHSRVAFARMYKSKTSANAADFLRRLVTLMGGRIQNLHIDNGSEFAGHFMEAAKDLNIGVFHARPYTPKDKPLVERFNGILQQEYVNLGNLHTDPEVFNPDLVEWLIYYNFVRPHHSLGLQRPAEFANMVAARVLPMWSPMTYT